MRAYLLTAVSVLAISLSGPLLAAGTINLNSHGWLGNLKLDAAQLQSIKKAMEKALDAPIDVEQQCGEVRMDCVVRTAREWQVEGERYREIVIHIHTVGQASNVVGQAGGQWPTIAIK